MKLYNIFEELILEEIEKHRKLITEGVSSNDINMVINGDAVGKHYHVNLVYRSPDGTTSSRWVQVYDYARTTAGNDAISAFEVSKNNIETGAWKLFRLDRIQSFNISKVPFYKAISDVNPNMSQKYNKIGNNTPTLSTIHNKAKFNYQYKTPNKQNQNKGNEFDINK
jgi:predicted DNA-binding transcriptional regulator YafY